jgi:hypothetical protein
MACWLIPTIIGVILMWKIDRKQHGVGVLFGYYLVGCYVASLVLALQMPTTNLGGYTKRITASGMVFLAYCVGNVVRTHSARSKTSPPAGPKERCDLQSHNQIAFRVSLTSHPQIGPHAFLGEEAPLYPTGCKLILACSVTQMALAIGLRLLLIRRNKKRDEAAAAMGDEIDLVYTDGADMTDFENPHFRYVL